MIEHVMAKAPQALLTYLSEAKATRTGGSLKFEWQLDAPPPV